MSYLVEDIEVVLDLAEKAINFQHTVPVAVLFFAIDALDRLSNLI